MGNGNWLSVNHSLRCPWCHGAERCSVLDDATACICREADANEGPPNTDRTGESFWLHNMVGAHGADTRFSRRERRMEAAPAAERDAVYRALLAELSLSERHRENLRGRVGQEGEETERWIARGDYRSAPGGERRRIAEALAERFGAELLRRIPGCYRDEREEWTIAGGMGLLLPVRNVHGEVVALKVRSDEEREHGSRYYYLSSARHQGPGAMLEVHFPCGVMTGDTLRITEGELKADLATQLSGTFTISIPGVSSWREARPAVSQWAAATYSPVQRVIVAFDRDARTNRAVARNLKRLCEDLLESHENIELGVEVWNHAHGKGIDDVLAAGHPTEVHWGREAERILGEIVRCARAEDEAGPIAAMLLAVEQRKEVALLSDRKVLRAMCHMGAAELMGIRAHLRKHLGRDFSAREFDRALKETREEKTRRKREAERGVEALPSIEAAGRSRRVIAAEAMEVLARSGKQLFGYGGVPVRVVPEEQGVIVQELNVGRMLAELDEGMDWVTTTQRGPLQGGCPRDVAEHCCNSVPVTAALPVLRGVVTSPCFSREGALIDTLGYHAESGLYFAPKQAVTLRPVTSSPSRAEIARAKGLILEGIFGEFPFDGDASRAHALAGTLLPFVRNMVTGSTPAHAIDAPREGTGKGLLADGMAMPFLGERLPAIDIPESEDEVRKELLSILMQGPSHVFFDNVNAKITSGALARTLTIEEFQGRILGMSRVARLKTRAMWIVAGNNIQASKEIARRMLRIRIAAPVERPTDRVFEKALRPWIMEQRAELIWACLTLVQGWIAAGRPQGKGTLASYESWSAVMGGILDVAEVPGFLGNGAEAEEEVDADTAAWRSLVGSWYAMYSAERVTVAMLYELAERGGCELPLSGYDERGRRTSFGRLLRRQVDCVYAGLRVRSAGMLHSAATYRLELLDGEALKIFLGEHDKPG